MWEFKGGTGRWQEYVNSETNESSIKEHTTKVISEYCKPEDHYFIPLNPKTRECKCKNCGFITTYVLGLQKLLNGKITTS